MSKKNNEGKGYGVRVVGTLVMVLFNKSSLRIRPVYQILVNPMNGLFRKLLSTVYYLMEMGSDSDEIVRKLAFKKSTTSADSLGRFAA